MKRVVPLFVLAVSLVSACGGRVDLSVPDDAATSSVPDAPSILPPSPHGTTLSGSFHGQSVVVHDAIAVVTEMAGQQELLVAYTDGTNLCSSLEANRQQSSTHYVSLVILQDGTTPIAAGTYDVTPPGGPLYASGGYSSLDSVCQNNETANVASSGTITIDAITPTRVSGSFQITFTSGDGFKGTFDVPVCPARLDPATRATCIP